MNKSISRCHNRWMASLPVLLIALIVCLPAQGQRGGRSFPLTDIGIPNQSAGPKIITLKLDMRVIEGKVTADIVNCPLQKALQELADRTGIIFEFRSHDNPTVAVHLDKIPMDEAIQRIAPSHNAVFSYEPDGRIKKVRVFPRTGAVQQPSLVYLGSGAITKTNDDVDTPDQAIRALAGNARLEMKEKAIGILAKNKSEEANKALIGALTDPAPEIRTAAIGGLVEFQNHDALPEILKCLKDADPKVRLSAATAVALLGTSKNIPDLKPLSADKDTSVASEADKAITKWSAGIRK
jgi:hypothetical protein